MIHLYIGDYSDNGQITIVDEDRLCYLVQSASRGASGLRTISKALLKEFVDFVQTERQRTAFLGENRPGEERLYRLGA